MKVPFSWVKDFVDINVSAEELGEKLVSAGFEIEEIINLRDTIQNVVVGCVLDIKKHEDSNHLNICKIDIGSKILQIVTGAQNVKAGDKVPVALDGSVLPDGKIIKSGELRGVKSEGMLCSGGELNLIEEDYVGAGVNGILILNQNEVIGTDINDVIGNNEIVLDVAITANRPDCNSILGIAREIATVMNKKLKMPDVSFNEIDEDISQYLSVDNENYKLCQRYMARVVKDVKEVISPKIIRDRLKAVGIRPINNLVDVTNYVLIEIGQPMHAFDLDNLVGNKIIIREAQDGEKIVALDGKEYTLKSNNLVICDTKKPIAIAGVMGGEYSSICASTSIVALESARFARDSIRHTAREINLHSDSSARFEKGIDYYSQELGLNRALALFDKYGWGKIVKGTIDKIEENLSEKSITYDYNKINDIIGVKIEKNTIIDILNRLEIKTVDDGDILTSTIPLYREDIVGINDLTEEVIRINGYDIVEPVLNNNCRGGKSDEQLRADKIKNTLVGYGACEIISYSFITPKAYDVLCLRDDSPLRKYIEIRNPIGIDMSVMRTTLTYSMLKIIEGNYKRGNKKGRFFEVGNSYIPREIPMQSLPIEKTKLMLGFYGNDEDYYSIKATIDELMEIFGISVYYERANVEYLHPGRSAYVLTNDGINLGYVGEIHPNVAENFDVDCRIYVAELDMEYIVNNGIDIKQYKPISKYQEMQRDLALLTPIKTPASSILDIIYSACSDILEKAEVFDVYIGGQIATDKKSVAVNLTFRDNNKTLKEEEINIEINRVLEKLSVQGIKLR